MWQTARSALPLFLGSLLAAVSSMLFTVGTARRLGPAGSADFFAVLYVIFFIATAASPVNGVVARFTSLYVAGNQLGKVRTLARQVIRPLVAVSLVLVFVAIAGLPWTSRVLSISSPAALAFGVATALTTVLLNVPRGVLRGMGLYVSYGIQKAGEPAARCIMAVIILWAWPTATGAICAYLGSVLLAVGLAQWQVTRAGVRDVPPAAIDRGAIFRFAPSMFVFACGGAAFQNIDLILVRTWFGADEVGMYGSAATLARVLTVIHVPLNTLVLPRLSAIHVQSGWNSRAARRSLLEIIGLFLALSPGPLALFWLMPGPIITLVFGERFVSAADLLLPLAAALVLGGVTTMLGQARAAVSRFGFLVPYLAGMAGKIGAIVLFGESLVAIAVTVVIAEAVTLLVVGVFVFSTRKRDDTTRQADAS